MLVNIFTNPRVLSASSHWADTVIKNLKTIVGSIGLQLVLAEIPFTASILKVTPLPYMLIVGLFFLSFIIIIVFEFYKVIYNRKKNI